MRTLKLFCSIAACLLTFAHVTAHADMSLLGGRPQIGIELEHEKAADGSSRANSMTLFPGIAWKEGWITRAELLLMREHEVETSGGVTERSEEYAYGIRLRKDVQFTENFGGFVRTLIGRKGNKDYSYNYGYIEPALQWKINERIELYSGYRLIRGIGSSGSATAPDKNQLRMGPGFDIDERHGVDLRWSRTWDAHSRVRLSDSVEVEYNYRF